MIDGQGEPNVESGLPGRCCRMLARVRISLGLGASDETAIDSHRLCCLSGLKELMKTEE
jgi:hypothetical protein